ncbi:MAG: hypothetical protein C0171_01130 [Caldisphaera sp.]|nr:MAG: hypothetical protein C0201_01730 [Caldisphaera sp.]PMP92286.1 MAG: hypothetical protein C0171_01130 [Caldisphaera sp.]
MGESLSEEKKEEFVEKLRKSLDLTLYEAKLYLALLEGAKDPKEASVKSGVPLPRIYDIIKVLEMKGMAVSDPKGWYRAVHPRAVAVSAIARLEEESKKKVKEILDISDNLENIAMIEKGKNILFVKGYYNLISLIAETMKESDVIYITIGRILSNWNEILKPIVKSILPLTNDLRIIMEELNEFNKDMRKENNDLGIKMKLYKPIFFDLISSRKAYIIVMKNPEGIIGVLQQEELESREVYDRLNIIWKDYSKEII